MSLAPPFTHETAHAKVKKAQDLWNTQNPKVIAQAYTPESIWRNRSSFLELFAFTENKIAVQFWYEFQDAHDGMKWKRCYGLEDWTFAEDGKMRKRQMSGNNMDIDEAERWFKDGVDVNQVDISEAHW
ncbi:uncharacterized protein SETTUDRAFT_25075 [Exserohilum turcica Et28A]|uniref:DUF1348-domain-containing protein n=1 Tax=Exserohilum turcicum (strain 28A) TaxID=671987 RepID=R0J1Y8_EXST2|nr:uncharacterized protein SETTUDRAFT_25075 [Exserohilum turcica Et28A]EOA90980.1 hypothetical protein SETTUDRAFT_25075 [Exserohilum turcica Et28A]